MTSDVPSTGRSSSQIPNWILYGILGLTLLGFLDASYLAAEHYAGRIPPCSVIQGCETVLTSEYAALFGVPVALFGALFYLLAFFLTFIYRETKKEAAFTVLFVLSVAALLSSAWFVYLQLFVLRAICLYCMISAGTSTLIFILALLGYLKYTRSNRLHSATSKSHQADREA